uniref:U-box domain-containing protein n=1 Tax=viral metagenome TaxID=1070528 RepID=A0A6C0F4U2_9ZZZZ
MGGKRKRGKMSKARKTRVKRTKKSRVNRRNRRTKRTKRTQRTKRTKRVQRGGTVATESGDAFKCSITQHIMRDPVVDKEGNSYERDDIMDWLQISRTSPITRNDLTPGDLVPNRALKDAIDAGDTCRCPQSAEPVSAESLPADSLPAESLPAEPLPADTFANDYETQWNSWSNLARVTNNAQATDNGIEYTPLSIPIGLYTFTFNDLVTGNRYRVGGDRAHRTGRDAIFTFDQINVFEQDTAYFVIELKDDGERVAEIRFSALPENTDYTPGWSMRIIKPEFNDITRFTRLFRM